SDVLDLLAEPDREVVVSRRQVGERSFDVTLEPDRDDRPRRRGDHRPRLPRHPAPRLARIEFVAASIDRGCERTKLVFLAWQQRKQAVEHTHGYASWSID